MNNNGFGVKVNMKYKNEVNISINTIFIIYMIYSFISTFFILLPKPSAATLNDIAQTFIGTIFKSVFDNRIIIIAFFAIKLAFKNVYKEKLDETDFVKNKDMYRNIINNYNISTLNYIDNFNLNCKQSYTAKLLELQRKKIIKIENDTLTIIGEPKEEIDKVFVNTIVNNKVTMPMSTYEKFCEKDALDKELITKSPNNKKFSKSFLIPLIMLFILLPSCSGYLVFNYEKLGENTSTFIVIFMIIFFILSSIAAFLFIYNFAYIFKSAFSDKYVRTPKGKDINAKLDGLKIFMKEFGQIQEKEADSIILWDDYLLYSVMFNQNKKIIEEYSKYIDPLNSTNINFTYQFK